ncbi:MAG TPA: hypothetical protein VF519_02605 [Mycobacteriales bacterium]|jgi:heme-degrading monooxygenase HmoA
MYGTVMIATLKGSIEDVRRVSKEWESESAVPGYVGEDVLAGDDGSTVVVAVRFESRERYQALADDPKQDEWWSTRMAPLLDDVRWIDGEWELGAR